MPEWGRALGRRMREAGIFGADPDFFHLVDGRVVGALPWLLVRYPELRWDWLVRLVKQEDLQNRLGFLVSLARGLAEARQDNKATAVLRAWEQRLEPSRLLRSDSFSRSALTDAEHRWLASHCSLEAKHWNVLSTLSAETLRDADRGPSPVGQRRLRRIPHGARPRYPTHALPRVEGDRQAVQASPRPSGTPRRLV